jgi:hypothetical protein
VQLGTVEAIGEQLRTIYAHWGRGMEWGQAGVPNLPISASDSSEGLTSLRGSAEFAFGLAPMPSFTIDIVNRKGRGVKSVSRA